MLGVAFTLSIKPQRFKPTSSKGSCAHEIVGVDSRNFISLHFTLDQMGKILCDFLTKKLGCCVNERYLFSQLRPDKLVEIRVAANNTDVSTISFVSTSSVTEANERDSYVCGGCWRIIELGVLCYSCRCGIS